mgnify:FL=1
MLENIPSQSTMTELIGQSLFEVWQALCSAIDEKYDMERLWNTGGKNWTYEYKYRRGGKTLCGRVRRVRPAAEVRVCYSEVTVSTSSMVEKSRPRRLFSRLRGDVLSIRICKIALPQNEIIAQGSPEHIHNLDSARRGRPRPPGRRTWPRSCSRPSSPYP